MIRLFQIAPLIFALLLAGCLPAEDDGEATETQVDSQDTTLYECPDGQLPPPEREVLDVTVCKSIRTPSR